MAPLNVLIGPNGGGKTNFIDLLSFVREAADEEISEPYLRRGGSTGVVFRGEQSFGSKLKFGFDFDPLWIFSEIKGTYTFTLRVSPFEVNIEEEGFAGRRNDEAITVTGESALATLAAFRPVGENSESRHEALEITAKFPTTDKHQSPSIEKEIFGLIGLEVRNWVTYGLIETSLGSPVRIPGLARPGFNLRADGSNLTSVLHNLQNISTGEEAYQRIEEILRLTFPDFRRLLFPLEGGDGKLVLKWKEAPFDKEPFSVTFLSDGTIKFLCLLAIFLCPSPPALIMIEEPELGLHPDMIRFIAALAQEASERTQVVITTHSPQLVSALEPDQVVVVEKNEGATQMRRLSDRSDLGNWLKDFSLGELWQMGEIGGRP